MNNTNISLEKKKFSNCSFLKNRRNFIIWKRTILSLIIFLFITMTIISITNDGYKFITNDANSILNTTLLKTLVAIICGYGLTSAGCAMQSITKNDLAGPTTLGYMPAATLGIVVFDIIQIPSIPLKIFLSFCFAFISFLVTFLTLRFQKKNTNKSYKIILIGIIIGALLTTISSIITTYSPLISQTILPWIGTININISWDYFQYCAPLILIGILLIAYKTKTLNIIESGEVLSKSLGVNYELTFWIAGIGVILITVSSVVMIGSVTMLGIVLPHLIRMIFKTRNYKFIIPVSGILSALIIMFSLWINSKYTLGLNIFSAIASVPIFIYIVFRRNKNAN